MSGNLLKVPVEQRSCIRLFIQYKSLSNHTDLTVFIIVSCFEGQKQVCLSLSPSQKSYGNVRLFLYQLICFKSSAQAANFDINHYRCVNNVRFLTKIFISPFQIGWMYVTLSSEGWQSGLLRLS